MNSDGVAGSASRISAWGRLLDGTLVLDWVLDVDADAGFEDLDVVSFALPFSFAVDDDSAEGPELDVRLGGLNGSLRRFC